MATDVNKSTRKRKSDFYFNFEVNETDGSPSNSPEPPPKTLACTVSKTRECEPSTGTYNPNLLYVYIVNFILFRSRCKRNFST